MAKLSSEQQFFSQDNFTPAQKVLDVGCGDKKKVDWATGLDIVKTGATDVVHDLNSYPWPFADNTFDVIVASHVAEHIGDVIKFSIELHRIAKPGAEVRLATPHFTNPDAFIDPTHLHAFGYRTFEFMARPEDVAYPKAQTVANRVLGMEARVAHWYTAPLFEIVERKITFRKLHRLAGFPLLAGQLPLFYEYFLGGLAPARDMMVRLRVKKPS